MIALRMHIDECARYEYRDIFPDAGHRAEFRPGGSDRS
jgi:hypothetical protein